MSLNKINDSTQNPGRRAFIGALRRALHHLYDAIELRRSALLPMFGLNGPAGVSTLRRMLEDAIEALKPAPGLSPQSDAWRTYRVLYHRYVEQFDQQSVAVNLGLSIRQLRRQEQLALHTLADWLIEQHGLALEDDLADVDSSPLAPQEDADDGEEDGTGSTAEKPTGVTSELKWAERFFPNQQIAVDDVVRSAIQTMQPMMDAASVVVHCDIPAHMPRALAPAVSVRQIVLNLMLAAIRSSNEREMHIACGHTASHVWIKIQPVALPAGQDEEGLSLAARLATISGGHLEYGHSSDAAQPAILVLPVAEQQPVLAIDDNADSLHLLERYLSDSRYRLIGTRDPAQALPLAERVRPHAIILDVMLPEMDGWEVLGRLRENPATRHIPVIVCTILPQEALALTLGAAGFIRKPISRERLLWELDRQTQAEATKPETGSASTPKAGSETNRQGV
jgi:CheY-like chemotaxis protein